MHHKTRAAAALTAVVTAMALTACAPSSGLAGSEDDPAESSGDYTVGVLAPMTSWAGAIGVDMQQGWDMYWEENDNKAGDYTVATVWQDTASDPDTALTKARLLVEENSVDTVVGPLLASEGLVVGDYLAQEGVANLAQTAADDLTQRLASPLVVRTGSYSGSQMTYPAGAWAADEGYTSAATLCVDYAFGWESCGGFVSAFTAAGGTVDTQLWYPGDASDLSSYVSQLASLDVDVIFIGSAGGTDSSNFLRSASDFGLLAKTPIINNCCTTDQAILQDVGDIALGQLSVSNWAEGNDDPIVADFVAKYEEAYGVLPSSYAYGMYASAQMLAQAIASSDSKLTGEDLVTAVKAVDLSSTIIGGGSLDEYGNIVGPVFLREVVAREDGTLWNTVVEKFDDVSQFWTFEPDAFLANPAFSQEFQAQ